MAGIYFDYVIVGASRGGLSCAESIRSVDTQGTILIVSKEEMLPYKRTKLSKKLFENYSDEDFLLYSREWYRQQKITLYLGAEAADLAPDIYTLFLADGRKIGYGKLCIATGASPLRVPETEGKNVWYLREKAEGRRLYRAAESWRRICVVGTGIQGVEMAEQFARMGKTVDLIGTADRVMHGRVDEHMSLMIERLLREHGIQLHKVDNLTEPEAAPPCDGIVASVGVQPAVDWLSDAKIETRRGILIDRTCRTSAPDVFAAGDVTEPIFSFTSGMWHGAEYQGKIAGEVMAGKETEMEPLPFRMKLDLFDKHFYTLWYDPGLENDPDAVSIIIPPGGGIEYCRLFGRGGLFAAALFSGEQSIGKTIISPMAKDKASLESIAAKLSEIRSA